MITDNRRNAEPLGFSQRNWRPALAVSVGGGARRKKHDGRGSDLIHERLKRQPSRPPDLRSQLALVHERPEPTLQLSSAYEQKLGIRTLAERSCKRTYTRVKPLLLAEAARHYDTETGCTFPMTFPQPSSIHRYANHVQLLGRAAKRLQSRPHRGSFDDKRRSTFKKAPVAAAPDGSLPILRLRRIVPVERCDQRHADGVGEMAKACGYRAVVSMHQ